MGRRQRPARVVRDFNGHPHELDMRAIESAYFQGVVAGKYNHHGDLAHKAQLARCTVSRFFSGRGGSLTTVRAILAELGLKFEDVAKPVE